MTTTTRPATNRLCMTYQWFAAPTFDQFTDEISRTRGSLQHAINELRRIGNTEDADELYLSWSLCTNDEAELGLAVSLYGFLP